MHNTTPGPEGHGAPAPVRADSVLTGDIAPILADINQSVAYARAIFKFRVMLAVTVFAVVAVSVAVIVSRLS